MGKTVDLRINPLTPFKPKLKTETKVEQEPNQTANLVFSPRKLTGVKCIACSGSGISSKRKECYPCKGTGVEGMRLESL